MRWLSLLSTLSMLWGAKAVAPPYPVLNITFEADPKNTSQLLGFIIDTERYASYNRTISAAELLMHSNIHELGLDQWRGIMGRSQLNFSNIDVEKLKEIARTMNISTSVEYRRFTGLLSDPFTLIQKALHAINVDDVKVMYYTLFNQVGDEHFFDAFQTANLSNLAEAQRALEWSDRQVFDFGKSCILKYMRNVTLFDFARLMKNITGEVRNFSLGYEMAKVGLIKSASEVLEVYPEGAFANMLKIYNDDLQTMSPEILATRVKTGTYVSSGGVQDIYKNMSHRYAKSFLVEGVNKFEVQNITYNGHLVELRTNDNVSHTVREGFVKQFQSCLYSSTPNHTVTVNVTYYDAQISIPKGMNVVFVRGAPLFCDSQLVGVASKENLSTISFAKVPFKLAPQPPPSSSVPVTTPPPPVTNTSTECIAKVHFTLINAHIPQVIGYLLMDSVNGNQSEINTERVSTDDVITSFRLHTLTYPQFAQLLSHTTPTAQNASKTINLLQMVNASMINIYDHFRSRFNGTQLKSILDAVNISSANLHRVMYYYPNNEAKFQEVIYAGNFNKSSVQKAFKLAALTEDQIFDILKSEVLNATYNFPLRMILGVIEQFGGYSVLKKQIIAQNIRPEVIKARSAYRQILNVFEARLQNASALAPIISRGNVLTVREVFDSYNDPTTKEFVSVEVEIMAPNRQTHGVAAISAYTSGYANITLESQLGAAQRWLPVATELQPKLPDQCKLMTDTGVYHTRRVASVREGFEITLGGEITREVYKLGAALVCEERLYGVAAKLVNVGTLERIQFAAVREGATPILTDSGKSDTPTGAGNTFYYNTLILVLCIFCSFVGIM